MLNRFNHEPTTNREDEAAIVEVVHDQGVKLRHLTAAHALFDLRPDGLLVEAGIEAAGFLLCE